MKCGKVAIRVLATRNFLSQPKVNMTQKNIQRLLWIINHNTLLAAEVPLLRILGWEVFIPKIIPSCPDYRSSLISYDFDKSLTIPDSTLKVLNAHDFYAEIFRGPEWSITLQDIINKYFDIIIVSISGYITPLREAVDKFQGTIIARAFGREHPETYSGLLEAAGETSLLSKIEELGERFVFAQGYENIAEVEPQVLTETAYTITVPLPSNMYCYENIWHGSGQFALFLCPSIRKSGGYYKNIYDNIKRDFGDLPHRIFGRQDEDLADPTILPYLSGGELVALYAKAPVFVYPSTEPRHIHYSPVEAMLIGTPVLYRRGALIDLLADGADNPGACVNTEEMRAKARRLIGGDRNLADAIRIAQSSIVLAFSPELAKKQWDELLRRIPLRRGTLNR